MSSDAVIDLVQKALWAGFGAAWPLLAVALVVGAGLGLLQALTQVQEQSITFVPKVIAVGVTLGLGMGLMGQGLGMLMRQIADRIAGG